MTAGLLLGAVGSAALLTVAPSSSYARLLAVLLGLGVGMGLLTAAVVAAAVRAVRADRAGLASGVNNTARQAGGAIGIAIYGATTGSPTHPAAFTAGLHLVGAGGALLWLVAVAVTWVAIPGDVPHRAPYRG